jgi:hypothetical protein
MSGLSRIRSAGEFGKALRKSARLAGLSACGA